LSFVFRKLDKLTSKNYTLSNRLNFYILDEMVTHFNMISEQTEVLKSNLTATHINQNFHMLNPKKESDSHAREDKKYCGLHILLYFGS